MFDITKLFGSMDDQDKGARMWVLDPITGDPMDAWMLVVGPDSKRNKAAKHTMADKVEKLARKNELDSETREKLSLEYLGSNIIDWNFKEGSENVNPTPENVLRVLGAGSWLRAQVDEFAGSRTPYWNPDDPNLKKDIHYPAGYLPEKDAELDAKKSGKKVVEQ